MQKQEEEKVLELFRAVTETQKQMVLDMLERCVCRNNKEEQDEMRVIIGYLRTRN